MEKVNKAHKVVVKKLELQDRVYKTTERESFITLKDHKEGFQNNPKCRLLNPRKVEVGKISHKILSNIVTNVRDKTGLNHWKNVYSCIDWFKSIQNKQKKSFIVFDIVNFYPSITLELLTQSLDWASSYTQISDEDRKIIIEARKSFLFYEGTHWAKKQSPEFDVPMGSHDGAEICDLVGLFLLSELKKPNINIELGCYKDDGLAISSLTKKQTETLKKKMCATFRKYGLEITIEANKKTVQFLDVEMNLETNTYKPYLKPGDTPLYVNANSNHPPSILKNIPEGINRRLSSLSSDENMFNSVAPIYQEALDKAGYKFKLKYKPEQTKNRAKKRQRKRNVTWWNPPYSSNVKTSIGRKFFKLLDQHFPKNHPLHEIINRNTVKMSYRTTPNFKKIISAHNSKILNGKTPDPPCNCINKDTCPLDGNCRASNIVYQATLTTEQDPPSVETYVGLTATEFKERHSNHKTC